MSAKKSATRKVSKKVALKKSIATKSARKTKKTPKKQISLHKAKTDLPVHALLRIRSEDGQTIKAHGDMIATRGFAFFGKIGHGLAPKFIKDLTEQIANKVPTFLFLTTREGWNGPYVTYQCRLRSVLPSLNEEQLGLVPKYYSGDYENVTTWFGISSLEKMSREEMNRIFVVSSGRVIMSVINSSATVFRVALNASNG